jgi:hypothetical protein
MGDITCFVSILFFCVYLVQARANRSFPSVWLYVVPLYAAAGPICFFGSVFRRVSHGMAGLARGLDRLTEVIWRQRRTLICCLGQRPGQRPRKIDRIGPSAVSATQLEVAFPEKMKRAYRAGLRFVSNSLGVAQGKCEAAPLALPFFRETL